MLKKNHESKNIFLFKMRKKIFLVVLSILLCSFSAFPFKPVNSSAGNNNNYDYIRQFHEIIDIVDSQYVRDIDQPTREKMMQAAFSGMLLSLDPHSTYYTQKDLEDFEVSTKGEFGGIGVTIEPRHGSLQVISPIQGLAADRAGIQAGDYIVYVNGQSVEEIGVAKALYHIRGKVGSKVKIKISRIQNNKKKLLEYEITRETMKINSVKYHIDGDIAYIQLTTFHQYTFDELKNAINKIGTQVKGMVLDLRNNPGGLLTQAIKISEYFLDPGMLVVKIKYKDQKKEDSYYVNDSHIKAPKLPIIVLINSGSASASEIFASALKEHKKAIIMGTKSYGKGSVQAILPLRNKGAIKLTTALYYTPNGNSVQGHGITPDIEVKANRVEINDKNAKNDQKVENTNNKDTLNNKKINSKHKALSLENINVVPEKFKYDNQYARAIELLKSLILLK